MLWVKTQNKRSLVNVKEITDKGKAVEGIISRSFFVYWSRVLGEYDSHVSAMEVVEQIHKKLEHGGNCLAVLLCLISRIQDYYAVSNISLERHFFIW